MSWRLTLGGLVERRLGICLRLDAGSEWIRRFVSARAEALGLSDAAAYVDKLGALGTQHDEWKQLIFVVSNGQTAFFRDAAQLELVGEILEDLAHEHGSPIHVWSAGCATGEEPYSIAMIAHARRLPVRVVGTDINEEFLERAARGRYGSWSLRRMPDEWRRLYLDADGDGFVVDERVRSMVSFARHNLTEAGPPLPPGRRAWDVVLCRNVFIYFAPETIRAALTHMSGVLASHGWLFLGASEGLVTDIPALAPLARHGRIGYRHAVLPSSVGAPALPPPRITVPTLVELPPESAAPPADVADDLYGDATTHIELGHFDRAVQLLEELVTSEPDHLRGRITLGNVLLSQHHFDRAAEAYAEAQALAPLVAEVHYFQGVLHRKTRELEPAAAAFRRALFLDDTFWPAAYQHASVLRRLGRLERSRAELGHALRALEKSGRRLPFHSQVSGLSGLCDPPERVAEACRSQLAAHAENG